MNVILRFKSIIEINGVNPYVVVLAVQVARLKKGWRKPMPVCVRVNGVPEVPWRINLMPVGDGNFYLYLHGIVRKASGTKVGDEVTVEVWFDEEYRNGPMSALPSWFKTALKGDVRAKEYWDGLSPSRQKEVVRYFSGLKSEEAQVRNLERVMFVLGGGKARFMGREWNGSESIL